MRLIVKVLAVFFLIEALASCATNGLHEKSSSSWRIQPKKKNTKTLRIGVISADKSGGSLSLESEIGRILPLLFLEKRCVFIEDGENADFIVDVYATERDYFAGWKTKKSIALEVSLRANRSDISENRVITPLASGRTIAQGTQGLSSSKNLAAILRASIKKAVRAVKKIKPELYAEARDGAAENANENRKIYEN
jgi:hypothetical protein